MTSKAQETTDAEVTKTGSSFRNSNKLLVVGSKFKIGKKINSGNFGKVWLGKNVITNEVVICIIFLYLYTYPNVHMFTISSIGSVVFRNLILVELSS